MAMVERTPMQDVVNTVRGDNFKREIARALPGGVTTDRFIRVTVTALNQSPELITTDRASLFTALIKCAQDGLLPDGREAALVKFGDTATYMPMIGGLRKIAAKHGLSLAAYVVYENDEFSYELGITPDVHHKPPHLTEDRGDPIGAYAVATDRRTGEKYLDVMSKGEIERIRQESKGKNSGPWTKHWGEMARKTVGRRLFKQLPLADLDEADSQVLDQADSEFEREPGGMSVAEANVSAGIGNGTMPADDGGPDDTLVDAARGREQVEDAERIEFGEVQ